jgi:hypothetical protein
MRLSHGTPDYSFLTMELHAHRPNSPTATGNSWEMSGGNNGSNSNAIMVWTYQGGHSGVPDSDREHRGNRWDGTAGARKHGSELQDRAAGETGTEHHPRRQ